jgi:uncharacterized protein YgbK (DUF1537 family)
MPPQVGIVADDLTGAADTGVAFLAAGLRTIVSWPDIDNLAVPEGADVVSFDTDSRASDREYAGAITARFVARLREIGTASLYKKIDSTLRGHVGVEVQAALHTWHAKGLAIVAPAFPRTGRTTANGYQCVDGVPLQGRGSVAELLETIGLRTRGADLDCVRNGALESVLLGSQTDACAVVCDAETDADLETIARAGLRLESPVVWVGSGGLARALAVQARPTIPASPVPAPLMRRSGSILIVVGTRNRMSLAQAQQVAAEGSHRIDVPMPALRGEMAATGSRIAGEIEARLRAGDDVVVALSESSSEAGAADAEDPRLVEWLGELLRPAATAAGGFILTGGATARAILRASGVTAMRLHEEIDPGVVLSETIGERTLPVVTKAGGFGDRGTLSRARERLHMQMKPRRHEDTKAF